MHQQQDSLTTKLLEYARLAPSVHNAQPWHFIVKDTDISIAVEPSRTLGSGDPTGRETWISFGICLETLLQSAKGLGIKAEVTYLQTSALDGVVATVHIDQSTKQQHPEILTAITERHTYREKMRKTTIPPKLIANCKEVLKDFPGTGVVFMQDSASIRQVGGFTYKAMSLALGDPKFRDELYRFVNYNWSPSRVGIHGYALGDGTLGSIIGKLSIKLGLGSSVKAKRDQQRINEASALVFITTKGDVPSFWFQAGRAYLRVALEIARTNLVQGTLAAPVEAASFHEDIEALLHADGRIQTMIRVGEATVHQRFSPRLRVDELA